MAKIASGRAGMITERDLELLRALAFCPLLSVEQVFRLDLPRPGAVSLKSARKRDLDLPSRGFTTRERARQRLYQLASKGYVKPYKALPEIPTLWSLTAEGHRNVVRTRLALPHYCGLELEYTDYEPDPVRVNHNLEVTEIFVKIQPLLTRLHGPLPAWDWREERRAFASWNVGGRLGQTHTYKPDAEIEFGDLLLILERQTASPHKTAEEIHEKIESHAQYLGYTNIPTENARTIFACDNDRDAFAAEQAGDKYGITVHAGTPQQMVSRIYEAAHQQHNSNGVAALTQGKDQFEPPPSRPASERTSDPDSADLERFTEVPF